MIKLQKLLAEAMSPEDAKKVFAKHGVKVDGMYANDLRRAYRKLVLSLHPDVGGDTDEMKLLNIAYATLKNAPSHEGGTPRGDYKTKDVSFTVRFVVPTLYGRPYRHLNYKDRWNKKIRKTPVTAHVIQMWQDDIGWFHMLAVNRDNPKITSWSYDGRFNLSFGFNPKFPIKTTYPNSNWVNYNASMHVPYVGSTPITFEKGQAEYLIKQIKQIYGIEIPRTKLPLEPDRLKKPKI
jgi:hypothetical protein